MFCLDILPEPSPQEWTMLVEKAHSTGGLTIGYKQVDVTKPELVEAAVREIVEEAPEKVRVLVAAAGSKSSFLPLANNVVLLNVVHQFSRTVLLSNTVQTTCDESWM